MNTLNRHNSLNGESFGSNNNSKHAIRKKFESIIEFIQEDEAVVEVEELYWLYNLNKKGS